MLQLPNTILLVVNNPDINNSDTDRQMKRLLVLDGYEVTTVPTVKQLFNRRDWHDVLAIILDRDPLDAGSLDILPRLREVAPTVAIVIVASHADFDSTLTALRHGAEDYLIKPVNPQTLQVIIRRIAQREKAKLQLRLRDRAIEAAANGIVIADATDSAMPIVYVNRAFEQMTGYSREETLGKSCRSLLGEQCDEQDTQRLHAVFATEREARLVLRHFRKDGTLFYNELFVSPIRDIGGQLTHFVITQTDVTDRINDHEEIEREKAIFEGIVNGVPDSLMLADVNRTITHCNAASKQVFGYDPEELIGQKTSMLYANPEDHRDQGQIRFNPDASEQREPFEVRWRRKNGEVFPGETVGTVIRDHSGRPLGFLGLIRDISERKQLQRLRLQSERLAAIGEAMAGLVHESRNALNVTQSSLRMIERRTRDRPDLQQFVDGARESQQSIQHLFERVRQYAAPIVTKPEPCDISLLVDQVWKNLKTVRDQRTIKMIQTRDVPADCEACQLTLGQVFRNIFENALAASEDPVEVRIRYSECKLRNRPAIQVSVSNNGPQLTKEQREKMFNAFYTTKTQGTGLGLAISKRIVEAHGGKITVGDTQSEGVELVITLPRKQSHE